MTQAREIKNFNNTVFTEIWDPETLNNLIHCELLSSEVRENLKGVKKKLKKDKLSVKYDFAKLTKKTGRMYPSPYYCLTSTKGSVRRIIVNEKCHDIDIVNCHYSILRNLCEKYDIECEGIARYCDKREEIIRGLQELHPELDRGTIKDEFIIVLNGGTCRNLENEPIVKQIKQERNTIIYMFKCLEDFRNIAKVSDRLCDRENITREDKRATKFLSRLLFTVENQCLRCMYDVCDNNNIEVCSMIYDGMMIYKGDYNTEILIDEMKENIDDNLGFKIDIIEKSMALTPKDKEIVDSFQNTEGDESIRALEDVDCPDIMDIGNALEAFHKECDDDSTFREYAYSLFAKVLSIVLIGKGEIILRRYVSGIMEFERSIKPDFKCLYEGFKFDLRCGKTTKNVNVLWDFISQRKIPSYKKLIFKPVTDHPSDVYNTFTGIDCSRQRHYTPEELAHVEKNEMAAFIDHIRNNWCQGDEEVFEYVNNWIGYTIKYPQIKVKTALVLSGPPGSGKGVAVDLLQKIFGRQYVARPNNMEEAVSRFGKGAIGESLLLFLDEAHWGGDIKMKNSLKKLISETSSSIEKKFLAAYNTEVYYNVIIASNEDRIVSLDNGQRRYLVLESEKMDKPYYDRIFATDIQVMYDYYCSRDYPFEFELLVPPTTIGTQLQMDQSMDNVARFISDTFIPSEEACGPYIFKKETYNDYRRETRNHPIHARGFWKKFRKYLPKSFDYTGKSVKGREVVYNRILSPEAMMDDFKRATNITLLDD